LSGQLEWFHNDVNDKLIKVKGGVQCIQTNDAYTHPLNVRQGLPLSRCVHIQMMNGIFLPHVVWTSDATWDPSVLDHDVTDDEYRKPIPPRPYWQDWRSGDG
jgi:hypothetical protein